MRHPPKARLLVPCSLALAVGLGFNSCGGDTPQVGTARFVHQRLTLESLDPLPTQEVRRLGALVPGQELGNWVVEAPEKGKIMRIRPASDMDRAPGDPKGPGIRAAILDGKGRKRLRIPGRFDPSTFNQVLVRLTCYGKRPELVRLTLNRNGKQIVASPWLSARSGKYPHSLLFEYPHLRQVEGTLDELVIELKGNVNTSAVSRIELLHTPLIQLLPRAGGPGELVQIADQGRHGVGLSSRHPLAARFEVPAGGELEFSCGLRENLRMHGERPRLSVRVAAEGTDPIEVTYELESARGNKARWHSQRVDLKAFAGRQVTATFSLQVKGEHEGFCVVAEAAVSRRGVGAPTVLLVTSDTHRGDHLGLAAEEAPVVTPTLDALAARGVYFAAGYSTTNVTNPSHAALMTATNPRDTRILNNHTPLVPRALTLAEQFRDSGYRTFASISAHHLLNSESGLGQGFDRLDGPAKSVRDGAETVSVLEDWVTEAAGQPLFVWLHLFDAHAPYDPPPPFDRRYYPRGEDPYDMDRERDMPAVDKPPHMKGLRDRHFPYQQYRAEVDYVDQLMGRVLAIERFRDGIVAFTADHGESFGEHGIWWDHADLYPQSVHVPLILSWPGGPQGERCEEHVSHTDLGRTLLDLAGLDEREFPGRNLQWALEEMPETLPLFRIAAHSFSAAIQSGDWYLILHLRKHQEWALEYEREAHSVELYNLGRDPACVHNLVREDEHFERAKRMRSKLIEWLRSAPTTGLGTTKVMTERELQSLNQLGYSGTEEVQGTLYEEDPQSEWAQFFER